MGAADPPGSADGAARRPEPPPAARRCYLSVMFCDLCDSTSLSAAREAEHYAELLARLRMLYESAVARHRGTVVRIQGDGMLAIFGYPAPREGDGRRAAEAALDLHAMVRSLALPPIDGDAWPALRLHTGIHSGLVLVQPGDLVIGRFELLGNVPNIASKLSDAAGCDETLVSEETLGPEGQFFETGPRRLLPVSGRAEPVAACNILGRAAVRTRFEASTRRGLSPFIGRASELLVLQNGLDQALAGTVRQVAVVAQAGVGKTRLSHQFLALAARRGCRTLAGYCENELSAEPLQPLLQVLRGLFGLTPDMPPADATVTVTRHLDAHGLAVHRPALLRALSLLVSEPAAAAARRPADDGTVAALEAVFAKLLASEPLVLFIDDWQWADAATQQAMAAIRALPGAALLVLLATRSVAVGDATMNDIQVVELAPFSDREAAQSIGELLPRVDPFVAAEISRHSGGNALFIEELCHSAACEDMDRRLVRLHGATAWLSVLVESRVARLPEAQAELVRTAAVIGNVVPAWLLHDLTGCAEDHALVRGLAAEDFIFPGQTPGTLRFKHGMTRDVVYDSVGLHARRALHARIAEALRRQASGTADEAHEALAYHYGASGQALEAAHHAELAGDKAVSVSALDRAKAQYRAALAALELRLPAAAVSRVDGTATVDATRDKSGTMMSGTSGTSGTSGKPGETAAAAAARVRWIGIANKLGLVCVFDAGRQDLAIFRRAVELTCDGGDSAALARAEYWLGYVHYALGEGREAIHHCRLALAAAQAAAGQPSGLPQHTPGFAPRPTPVAAEKVGDASQPAVAATATASDPLSVQIRATLGQAMVAVGDYDGALPLLDEAIAIKQRHRSGGVRPANRPAVGLAYSLVCRACVMGDRGEFDAAHAVFEQALAAVHGLTHEIGASIHGWHAAVLLWQGRWDDARRAAAESTRIAEQTRGLYPFCMARAADAYADWMTSHDAHALQRLRQATAWLEPREGALFRSLNHGWLADGLVAAALAGTPAAAPAGVNAAGSAAVSAPDSTTSRADAQREARHHAARALLRGRSADLIGVAMACRAMALDAAAAGNRPRAERCLERALRVGRARGSQHELASTWLCRATIAQRFGERSRALAALDHALPAFERMDMHWHLAHAERLAREV